MLVSCSLPTKLHMVCDRVSTPAVGDWSKDPYPGGVPGVAPSGPWPLVQTHAAYAADL